VAELEMDKARLIWQSQPTAPRALSREEILKKAKRFQIVSRARIGLWWGLVILLVLFGIYDREISFAFAKFVVACLIVLGFEYAYGFRHEMDLMTLGLNAASSPGLVFYRSELQRRKNFFERSYQRILLPALFLILQSLPFVGLSLRAGTIANLIPVAILLTVWMAFIVSRKRRELPAIERELEGLNAMAGQSES